MGSSQAFPPGSRPCKAWRLCSRFGQSHTCEVCVNLIPCCRVPITSCRGARPAGITVLCWNSCSNWASPLKCKNLCLCWYVCICVYTCVYMGVCVSVCTHLYMCVRVHMYMYMCVSLYMCVHVCARLYMCVRVRARPPSGMQVHNDCDIACVIASLSAGVLTLVPANRKPRVSDHCTRDFISALRISLCSNHAWKWQRGPRLLVLPRSGMPCCLPAS